MPFQIARGNEIFEELKRYQAFVDYFEQILQEIQQVLGENEQFQLYFEKEDALNVQPRRRTRIEKLPIPKQENPEEFEEVEREVTETYFVVVPAILYIVFIDVSNTLLPAEQISNITVDTLMLSQEPVTKCLFSISYTTNESE